MIARFGRFGAALIILALLQTIIIGWIVADRMALLRSPDTVTLRTEPVDPRDLFRGDYVTLAYGISRLSLENLTGDKSFSEGETVYVALVPEGEDWRAAGVWRDYPEKPDGSKIIRGRIVDVIRNVPRVRALPRSKKVEEVPCEECVQLTVVYGIESYFVPEGQGRKLEDARNAQALSVDVALARNGEAAIKGLRLDGELLYEEPLL
ncbi:MAG: GDYXXLXY domain-containing protein [Parvibaculum sp.]|uniref:GDYXXLXY domain-containing protein n=1 Tax=Parvibaculum sp. TaxID=2024848 RepID=UPI003C787A29